MEIKKEQREDKHFFFVLVFLRKPLTMFCFNDSFGWELFYHSHRVCDITNIKMH